MPNVFSHCYPSAYPVGIAFVENCHNCVTETSEDTTIILKQINPEAIREDCCWNDQPPPAIVELFPLHFKSNNYPFRSNYACRVTFYHAYGSHLWVLSRQEYNNILREGNISAGHPVTLVTILVLWKPAVRWWMLTEDEGKQGIRIKQKSSIGVSGGSDQSIAVTEVLMLSWVSIISLSLSTKSRPAPPSPSPKSSLSTPSPSLLFNPYLPQASRSKFLQVAKH